MKISEALIVRLEKITQRKIIKIQREYRSAQNIEFDDIWSWSAPLKQNGTYPIVIGSLYTMKECLDADNLIWDGRNEITPAPIPEDKRMEKLAKKMAEKRKMFNYKNESG